MGNIFNMDNKFFTFMGKVADLVILNLLFILCCLPVVTIGASCTAMHYVTLKMIRNEESYIVKGFFKSFKENFKQATIINLIMLAAGGLLILDLNLVRNMTGAGYKILYFLFGAFALVYFMILLYIYPVLAKFYNTIRNTFVNAVLMSIRHLPYTLLMMVISLLPIGILFIPNARFLSMGIMLFFLLGFSLISYVNAFFFRKIFDNYIPKEDASEEISAETENIGNISQS